MNRNVVGVAFLVIFSMLLVDEFRIWHLEQAISSLTESSRALSAASMNNSKSINNLSDASQENSESLLILGRSVETLYKIETRR